MKRKTANQPRPASSVKPTSTSSPRGRPDGAPRGRILLVDDEPGVLRQLELLLGQQGRFACHTASDARAALELLETERPDVLLLDLGLPEVSGLQLLELLAEQPQGPEVIVISGLDDVELAVRAMKLGAYDYLRKPLDTSRLLVTVERALSRRQLRDDAREIADRAQSAGAMARIITRSPQMAKLLRHAETIAPTDNPVLLWGDSGTGKELLARAIHELSTRASEPFVAVNAGVFAGELFASEFFGHIKGAFTGASSDKPGILEQAHGGTLFLDEIGELALSIQVKLLRVLQEGEYFQVGASRSRYVDVRLITATNKDLQQQIRSGNFRRDLFYRLNVCSLFVPQLKDREGDVPLLAQYLVDKYAAIHGKPVVSVSEDVLELMSRYGFPGNVRELENIINSGVLIQSGSELTRKAMPQYFLEATLRSRYTIADTHDKSISQVEKEHIERVLSHTRGNRSAAARVLGISRVSLISKIKQYKIDL
jgi:DNA-binding NtrC family response regulator